MLLLVNYLRTCVCIQFVYSFIHQFIRLSKFTMMAQEVARVYQLDDCIDWIIKHRYKRLILQFKNEDLKDSTAIVAYLKDAHSRLEQYESQNTLDLYVTQSNTCCVDLIVTQHVSNVDAIIHFGKVCLSKPHLDNGEEKPILFIFTRTRHSLRLFAETAQKIFEHVMSKAKLQADNPIYVIYDTNLVEYAKYIDESVRANNMQQTVEVAKLICPSPEWCPLVDSSLYTLNPPHPLGQYSLSRPLDKYKSAIYLGDSPSISLTLEGPSNQWKLNCSSLEMEKINVSRVLNKRMALVERLRDDKELKIGVIITNPLPNIQEVMKRLGDYAKVRNHTLYFISMIQTIDECKIGNFDLCDAFVVVNSCYCSAILESLYFNRPIINDLEFKLACGLETVYGRVLWPSLESHLSEDDMINKRKVSDVSMALVHSRNELLERCSKARANKWSGLDYKATADSCEGTSGDDGEKSGCDGESLAVEEGLHGIASSYVSEPLKRSDCGDQQDASSENVLLACNIPNIDDLKIQK